MVTVKGWIPNTYNLCVRLEARVIKHIKYVKLVRLG
jgi:hypothetical protein